MEYCKMTNKVSGKEKEIRREWTTFMISLMNFLCYFHFHFHLETENGWKLCAKRKHTDTGIQQLYVLKLYETNRKRIEFIRWKDLLFSSGINYVFTLNIHGVFFSSNFLCRSLSKYFIFHSLCCRFPKIGCLMILYSFGQHNNSQRRNTLVNKKSFLLRFCSFFFILHYFDSRCEQKYVTR